MNKNITLLFCLSVLMITCIPLKENSPEAQLDLTPPVLLAITTTGPRTLVLLFSEESVTDPALLEFSPELTVESVESRDRELVISLSQAMMIGQEYTLKADVEDRAGNSSWLIMRFYGHNPHVPRLVLNEFTTQGSSTHPDCVEIKSLDSGNMGGICFFHGTASRYKYRFVFPAFEVNQGDFILLHVKPQNIPQEIDETVDKTLSGGLDASCTAFDFWVKDGTGLSGNNGVITLYEQPGGSCLDAVLYSTRTSASDTDYGGFGSEELLSQAEELAGQGAWQASESVIRPEDAVNPELSTATRSLCRSSTSADTNSKQDFHIVPTKKSSFGTDNTDEVYVP